MMTGGEDTDTNSRISAFGCGFEPLSKALILESVSGSALRGRFKLANISVSWLAALCYKLQALSSQPLGVSIGLGGGRLNTLNCKKPSLATHLL